MSRVAEVYAANIGLSKVAHAIRRASALSAAVQVTEPVDGESEAEAIDRVLSNAEVFAQWLRGGADKADEQQRWVPPTD